MYNSKGLTAVEIPNMLASSDTKVEYQTPCIVLYALKCPNAFSLMPDPALALDLGPVFVCLFP